MRLSKHVPYFIFFSDIFCSLSSISVFYWFYYKLFISGYVTRVELKSLDMTKEAEFNYNGAWFLEAEFYSIYGNLLGEDWSTNYDTLVDI